MMYVMYLYMYLYVYKYFVLNKKHHMVATFLMA